MNQKNAFPYRVGVCAAASLLTLLFSGCPTIRTVRVDYVTPPGAVADIRSIETMELIPQVTLAGSGVAEGDRNTATGVLVQRLSSGFSREVRTALSRISGDILITNSAADWYGEDNPIEDPGSLIKTALEIPGVKGAEPAVYRAGIIKDGNEIYGALFKGTPADTGSLVNSTPSDDEETRA